MLMKGEWVAAMSIKSPQQGKAWWLMPVNTATHEVAIRRIEI
jgi:hypothetical protein